MTVTTWSKPVLTCPCGRVCPSGRCRRKHVGWGCGPEMVAVCVGERDSAVAGPCTSILHENTQYVWSHRKQKTNACCWLWYCCPQGCIFAPLLEEAERLLLGRA